MLKHEIYSLKQYQISIYTDIIYLESIAYDLKIIYQIWTLKRKIYFMKNHYWIVALRNIQYMFFSYKSVGLLLPSYASFMACQLPIFTTFRENLFLHRHCFYSTKFIGQYIRNMLNSTR